MEVTMRDGPAQDRGVHSWARDSKGIMMPPHSQNCERPSFRPPELPPFQIVLSHRSSQMQRRQVHFKELVLDRTILWILCLYPIHRSWSGPYFWIYSHYFYSLSCSFIARMREKTCCHKEAYKSTRKAKFLNFLANSMTKEIKQLSSSSVNQKGSGVWVWEKGS